MKSPEKLVRKKSLKNSNYYIRGITRLIELKFDMLVKQKCPFPIFVNINSWIGILRRFEFCKKFL